MEKNNDGPLKNNDFDVITRQLGREPRGNITVERRCTYGCPQVINTPFDLIDGPFPTTYWLTCPTRVKKISQLENLGWIDKLETELAADKEWQSSLSKATDMYVAKRLHPGRELGIAGTKNILSLKCLHAHLADYLVGGINPIGKKVANLVGEISCDKDCLQ